MVAWTGDFVAANRRLYDEMVWPHFWAIQLWLVVLLFMYCIALRELIRCAIGPREVRGECSLEFLEDLLVESIAFE